jgi:Ca2+-binding RTX toxin-like protein
MSNVGESSIRKMLTMIAVVALGAGTGCVPIAVPDGNGNGDANTPVNLTPNVVVDLDTNNVDDPFVQPQDPALAGGGRDQSLQSGGVLEGTGGRDVLIGRIGQDTLLGYDGPDVLIGGVEHFNPSNRDRALGGKGNDVFIWKPGDGSDFFDGQEGTDVLVLGLLGELENDEVVFKVINDQKTGQIYLDPSSDLPRVDVTGSPGFCTVVDSSTSAEAATQLAALGLDRLVRFSIRGIADAFDAGDQTDDNGLRVTIHTRNVEYLICTPREGGAIEVLDLTTTPPTVASLEDLAGVVPGIADMVF